MYEKLKVLFEQEVVVTVDEEGLHAEFTIDDPGEIQTIEIATRKQLEVIGTLSSYSGILNEFAWMDFEEIWNSDSGSDMISLDFEDMTDAVYLRMTTSEMAEHNESAGSTLQWHWCGFLQLQDDVGSTSTDLVLENEEEDGLATLSMKSTAVPDGTKFYFTEVPLGEESAYFSADTIESYRRFSAEGSSIVVYDSSIQADGALVTQLSGNVTLEVSLPENFDTGTTSVYMKTSDGQAKLNGMSQYVDEEKHAFVYTTSLASEINATYVFLDRGDLISTGDLTDLDTGVYLADVTISHYAYPVRPSMANASVVDNQGYLEVTEEDGERVYWLYYEMEPVVVSSIIGYMTGEWYCNGSDRSDYEPVDILEYYATEDGSLDYDDWAETYDFQYLNRLRLPLTVPQSDDTYLIRFAVPAMDTVTGDGSGVQYANLRVRNLREADENPLAGYDKSILQAMIDTAQRYLETLDADSSDYKTLEAAIEEAKSVYNSQNLTEEEIVEARDALKAVYENLGGSLDSDSLSDGTYQIAFSVLDETGESTSVFEPYFDTDDAELVVSGSSMTLTIQAVGQDGDYVNYFLYYDGSSASTDTEAEIVYASDGTTPESYILTRPYTGDPFEISIKSDGRQGTLGTAYTCYLALDVSSAVRKEASEEDVTELTALVATAKELLEGDYTSYSLSVLQSAIESAETYLSVDDPSYDIINSQTSSLQAAVDQLVSLADLRTQIQEYQDYTSDGYEESSWQTFAVALATAREMLVSTEEISAEAVSNQITALTEAAAGLTLADSGTVTLTDGEYNIPAVIYKNGSENTHSVNSYVESAELAVSGESTEMTVKLNFTSLDGAGEKWVTEMQYSLDEGTTMVDVTDYEYDESGNITSASFTVPYTEERLYVKFKLTGGYSYLKADLWLD
ncbi:MAG: hypothetical protein LUC94_06865, partial [Clostridiales bacterium]|nr:hypothetical protein [Clostridiales bacterium]